MEERLYDLIFICRPATPEEEIDKIIGTLENAVTERGGKVEKKEKWGARKMAYRVMRHREGYYVLLVVRASQSDKAEVPKPVPVKPAEIIVLNRKLTVWDNMRQEIP